MDLDEARQFLRVNHRAVLATNRADGRPQLSPVAVTVDREGRAIVSTRATAVKTHNVARDPHVSLCALTDGFFGSWVQIDGITDVQNLPEAMEPLVDYYRSVAGEHPDWDDYRAAMQRERRVLLRITITRAGPDRSG
jgi:PPOX class probable F420-dependent enzyme